MAAARRRARDAIDARHSRVTTQARDLPKQGVVFATYASLLGKKGGKTAKPQTRLDQLLEWASPGFEGGLLFDESHKAKNLFGGNGGKPTKTGQAVLKLQTALPRARVVYCSATGASEPKHLGYMDRLGLWGGSDTPFGDFDDFRRAVESRGVGMMELVAMHLKQRGALVSRALSFKSCTFELVNDVMTPSLCGVLVYCLRGDGVVAGPGRVDAVDAAAVAPRERTETVALVTLSHAGTWSASTTGASRSGIC